MLPLVNIAVCYACLYLTFGRTFVQKDSRPVRLIVSWYNSPAYKTAKYITEQIKQVLQLPSMFNIKISLYLMNEVKKISVDPYTRIYKGNNMTYCNCIRATLLPIEPLIL
jgi:hypothetical protein